MKNLITITLNLYCIVGSVFVFETNLEELKIISQKIIKGFKHVQIEKPDFYTRYKKRTDMYV